MSTMIRPSQKYDQPHTKDSVTNLFYKTQSLKPVEVKTQWQQMFKRNSRFVKTTQNISKARLNESLESRKFNYSMSSDKHTFLLDRPYHHHKCSSLNQSAVFSEEPYRQTMKSYKWLAPKRPLSPARKKPRPVTVSHIVSTNSPMGFRRLRTQSQKIECKPQTAFPQERKGKLVDIKVGLGKSKARSHYSKLSEDLRRHGFNSSMPISEVLKTIAMKTNISTGMGSLNNSIDFAVQLPQANKNRLEDIKVTLPNVKQPETKNEYTGPLKESSYLKLLEKHHDFNREIVGPQVHYTLSTSLQGNLCKALKNQMLLRESGDEKSLNKDELAAIKEDLNLGKSKNLHHIEQILEKVKFFESFTTAQRLEMLSNVEYKEFSKDQIIIEASDIQDIYVVLCGAITVYTNTDTNVKRLVGGDIFGEELIVESDHNPTGCVKYSDTIFGMKVVKSTSVLVFPKSLLADIIYREMQDELYQKLYVMKTCPLFSNIPVVELLNLASRLPMVVKHYCEIIAKQSEIPNKCYIVASGVCKSLFECTVRTSATPSFYARKSHKRPLKALRFGLAEFNSSAAFDEHNKISARDNGKDERALNFSYDNQVVCKTRAGTMTYKSHVIIFQRAQQIPFGKIEVGEYFAGRVLLKNTVALEHHYKENPGIIPYEDAMHSQLTIVSDFSLYK
eukprot:TRINITY_DN1903_c0_g2_i1.p1 TRINITY_DN1903_c0_g2~~TRINITY_DN1903_c0_g2_i1.p1  ORF type:complete len:674 (-),score=41.81 TRINITY_DN1903_c0_g2_i1:3296-5317(-)